MDDATQATLVQLDALIPSGPYRAQNRMEIVDVTGVPVAELSILPTLFVHRAIAALRKSTVAPLEVRLDRLARAGELFRTAEIAGLSVEQYQHLVSRISGLGISEVISATERIARRGAEAYRHSQFARPDGAVGLRADPITRTGSAVWVRRGDVFGVHAAGNHPGLHMGWLEALALGYKVAVRPSRKEPVTAHRLVSALWLAGFGQDEVVLLPTDYAAADEMLKATDLSMMYGGDALMQQYEGDQKVLPRGPGRSKIVIGADEDWTRYIDLIVDSVSHGGGTGCTNTTTVLLDGDVDALAAAVGKRLAEIEPLPPEDPRALLPVSELAAAERVRDFVVQAAQGTRAVLPAAEIVADLGDGSAALRPAVHVLSSGTAAQAGVEVGFPCVWIGPWSPDDGIDPLRNSLVLTAIGVDDALIERALQDPTVRNVYVGPHATYWGGLGMPHDGYLADFLMKSKGYIATA